MARTEVDLRSDEIATDLDDYDAESVPLATLKARASALIDDQAGVERLRYITHAPGQETIYSSKREDALRIIAAGGVADPADYVLLASEIGITAPSTGDPAADLLAVAQVVNAQASAWATIGGAIEAVRLAKKAAVASANSSAEVAALFPITWPTPS